jgi:hypothetical protein
VHRMGMGRAGVAGAWKAPAVRSFKRDGMLLNRYEDFQTEFFLAGELTGQVSGLTRSFGTSGL